jgi:type II secretory pathway pseudopilin PulG
MRVRSRVLASDSGFTLIDVCVGLLVLAIAVGALVGTMFTALRLDRVNESRAAANQALRALLEDIKAMEFSGIYAAYNTSTADDPDPQHDYKTYLDLEGDLPAGSCGAAPVAKIYFPEDENGLLREDLVDERMGLPRDLDGDGAIDGDDHSADYKILPVVVQLDWEDPSGPQSIQVATVIRRR